MTRALCAVVGLVVVQVGVFGVVLWRHQNTRATASVPETEVLARTTGAPAPDLVAPVAPAAAPTAAPPAQLASNAPAISSRMRSRHPHRARRTGARSVVAASAPGKAPAGKPDELDDLLRRFK